MDCTNCIEPLSALTYNKILNTGNSPISQISLPISLCQEDWGQLSNSEELSNSQVKSYKKPQKKQTKQNSTKRHSLLIVNTKESFKPVEKKVSSYIHIEKSKQINPVEEGIPCEFCGKSIAFSMYESHIKSHTSNNSNFPKKQMLFDLKLLKKELKQKKTVMQESSSCSEKKATSPTNSHSECRSDKSLTPAQLDSLPQLCYSTNGSISNEQQYCIICLVEFSTNEALTSLPCCHIYHKSCIDAWLLKQPYCPFCKTDVCSNIL